MSETSTNPGNRSASDIETDVERTRESVSETLHALRGRMEPSQIVEQVVDRVADYARGSGGAEFARNLGAAMRDNPLPVLLIGAGIGWLLLSHSQGTTAGARYPHAGEDPAASERSSGVARRLADGGERVAGAAQAARGGIGQVADALGDAASSASGYVSQAASAAADYASQAASSAAELGSRIVARASDAEAGAAEAVRSGIDMAGEGARRGVTEGVHGLAEAQPLLFGALGFALGASLGAVLPRTQAEDDLLGEARDSVLARVSAASTEAMDDFRSVAGEKLEQVRDTVAENVSRVKEEVGQGTLGEGVQTLGRAGGQIARAAGDAVTEVASEAAQRMEQPGPAQRMEQPGPAQRMEQPGPAQRMEQPGPAQRMEQPRPGQQPRSQG